MSVMLATTNPDAAARITPRPMPVVSDPVIYHMRKGAMRAGQTAVAAWVLKVDEDNRLLKVLVVYSHDDMMTEERVPEWNGSDYGWEAKPTAETQIAELRNEVAGLRADLVAKDDNLEAFKMELAQTLFGDHDKPETSFLDYIKSLTSSVEFLDKWRKSKGKFPAL